MHVVQQVLERIYFGRADVCTENPPEVVAPHGITLIIPHKGTEDTHLPFLMHFWDDYLSIPDTEAILFNSVQHLNEKHTRSARPNRIPRYATKKIRKEVKHQMIYYADSNLFVRIHQELCKHYRLSQT
jgi:hypothetical protein